MKRALVDLALRSLDWIKKQSASLEAEVFLASGEDRGIELRNGVLESLQSVKSEGVGLRVLDGGRVGFASAGGMDLETVQGLYRKVAELMEHLEPDDKMGFPAAAKDFSPEEAFEASLWDDSLFGGRLEGWQRRLGAVQARVMGGDKRIRTVLRLGYGESRGEVVVANTRGVAAYERGSSATVGLSVLAAGKDEELQVGAAFQSSRRKADLDLDRLADDGARRATSLLDARKLPGGRRAVVIDPWVAGELLDLVAELLCADSVQRGKSMLAGRIGRRIGSELVTIVDDPKIAGGIASSVYDDEGCPTVRKTMVERGVLRDYFYDTYTANKDGRPSNASASRGSYRGIPGPAPSNLHMAAGSTSREKVIADTNDGILVLDILGMHMVDPVAGEISVGVSGIAIEGGRLTHAVKGCMISGNILELLGGIDMVGDDLTFYGALGSPTFRISEMTVA
ncbi:MAG: TldD/PmbA family protein [Elusimicrobia bacterium]|nr:TldD/PmbA family protein [Elusimicrobiota bacterium]